MDNLENTFIELGNWIEMILKEISFACDKGLRTLLDFIIEVFNKYSERYLTK